MGFKRKHYGTVKLIIEQHSKCLPLCIAFKIVDADCVWYPCKNSQGQLCYEQVAWQLCIYHGCEITSMIKLHGSYLSRMRDHN